MAVTSPEAVPSKSITVDGHNSVLPTTIPMVLTMLDTVVTALPESLRLNDPHGRDLPVILLSILQSEETTTAASLMDTHSVGLLAAPKGSSIMNKTIANTKTDRVARSESVARHKRTIEEVTEEELNWLHLFRQRPGPSEAKLVWLLRLEEMAGVAQGKDKSTISLHRNLALLAEVDDDELSEIDTSEIDRANLETSYIERLFE
jgi:hypothetical protein